MRGSLQDLVPLWIGSSKTKTVSEGYNESFWRWFGPWTGSLFARHYLCSLCSWWESVTCSIIFNLHENSRPDLQMSSTSGTSVHFNSESSTHPAVPILMAWKSHSVLATAQNHNYAGDFGAPVCSGLHAGAPANMLVVYYPALLCCNCSGKSRYLQKRWGELVQILILRSIWLG